MAELALRAVSKTFGETSAVDNVSIEVADGEFVALVGPSGCGKTTTLRILAGLEQATSGTVEVGGRDVSRIKAKDRNLAMVFQSYALYPHMTVGETIGFALRLQGRSRPEIDHAVTAAAERLEIAHLLHRKPRELSGGQRQRVAVARCIVRQPHAFLFDEPLSNLDAKLRASARVEIAKLQKALGVTSVYVTHDQVEAMTMADRIVLMEAGRIRQIGRPMDLYHRPADLFVAGFIGAPAMNLVPGLVQSTNSGRVFTAGSLSIPAPDAMRDGPASLGFRPEALSVDGGGIALTGTVSHCEQLGAETIVELRPENPALGRLTLRSPGDRALPTGTRITAGLDADVVHFFDAAGRRIGR